MKVVFVPSFPFSFMPPGGGVMQVMKTKLYLERLGVEVSFWNPENNYAVTRHADIFHIFSSDYPLAQLARMVKNLGYPYAVSTVFYQATRTKMVAHRLLSRVPLTQTALRRSLLKNANILLPNSRVEAEQVGHIFGIEQSKFLVVPNAVDTDFVGEDPEGFRKKFLPELPINEPFILSVALIDKVKNTLALIKAASRLGVPLVLVGRPSPLEARYVQKVNCEIEIVRKKTLVKHIPFIQHGPHLADAFAAAQVHALVSISETTGIASLEAALNGANVVVSALPPVLEYLGGHAWVVDPHSVMSICHGLESALNAPRNAKNAAVYIRENFTWERTAEKTVEGYRKVLTL